MKDCEEMSRRVLALAEEIQQIPAPTFNEQARGDFLLRQFETLARVKVSRDAAGNVLACLPGAGGAAPVVISAHLDTVFPHGTPLSLAHTPEAVIGAGIGDNALGTAGLLGLAWLLADEPPLPGDLWLAANTGEEGLGNLRGMRAVVERFGSLPKAYIVLEGMGLGEVLHQGLGVARYRLSVVAPGGHSWSNHGKPSAIHELARLATRLVDLPLPAEPRTTLNIGTILGGTSINTIAAQASCEIDMRSESPEELQKLEERAKTLSQEIGNSEVRVTVEMIGQRPAGEIAASHPLVALAAGVLRELGLTPVLGRASTDANIPLSLGYPAVCIGLTTGSGAHTLEETIETAPLAVGLAQLYRLTQRIWEI